MKHPLRSENHSDDFISRARKAVTLEKKNPKSLSHCTEDTAAAFLVPSCRIIKRCFKCRNLYNYDMHREAAQGELLFHNYELSPPRKRSASKETTQLSWLSDKEFC
jgi:predicted RNA-binding Zn-ribbon protein involved in translation (DUF1610 family)